MKRTRLLGICSLLGGTLFSTAPVNAQAGDWLAWHGCWQADGAPAAEYLCIVPDGAAAVRMVTVAGDAVVAESRVVTDGRARRVQTEGCDGSEVAFWSADYHRVFLSSELSCEGGVKRQASGVFAITSADSWISVQAVTIDGRTATRTVSYTAVDDAAAPATIRSALRRSVLDRTAARSLALSPIDAADVDEAVDRIDAAAVQEWLIASGQPFQLADQLAPAAPGVVTRSALDHTGYFTQDPPQPTRDVVHVVERPIDVVHVIERPVYVTHVHNHRFRSCWDPFFSGVVLGLSHGSSIGLGHAHCGRRYLTHFSPWGYDLFGWRFVHVRPIIIRGRPIIHHRSPIRPRRPIYTSHRDGERHTANPRNPTTPREDRTAQPRGGARVIRTAQPRDPAATPGRASAGTSGSTTRAIRSTSSNSQPVRTAAPRSAPQPRAPILTRDQTPRVNETPPRSAVPRAPTSTRTVAPPVRSATTTRVVQPRTPTRERATTSSGVSTTPRTRQQPAATSSAGAPRPPARAPARVAKPRGGEDKH